MSYPISRGVVALCGDPDRATDAAHDLASATPPEAVTEVTVHTAVPGHSGDWMAVVRAVGDRDLLARSLRDIADQGLFAAEFLQVKAHPVTWTVGAPTPGIGVLFAARRRPDLSHEQFNVHWRDRHAPLALKHHVGMWDYVQCSFEGPLIDSSPDYDGLAICQFASLEDYKQRFFDSDQGRAVIAADVRKFSDTRVSSTMRMTETVLR